MRQLKVAFLLTFMLLFQVVLFSPHILVSAQSKSPNYDGERIFLNDPNYNVSWSEYKLEQNVPAIVARYITLNGSNRFYFNMEVWEDKHIVVYGAYVDIPNNDFKNSTGDLDAQGKYVEILGKGYYEGGTGEYRHHGFDASGNKYANGEFPIDAVSGTKASAKNWIYRIWDKNISPYYSANRVEYASKFNQVAMGTFPNTPQVVISNTQNWINNGLPFDLIKSNTTDKNAYNYAHVLSAPSTLFAGQAQMYHLSAYDNKPWYQVFSLNPIAQKALTPVEAEIEIIGKEDFLIAESASVEFTLKITGTLKDEAMWDGKNAQGVADGGAYDQVERAAYYNRDDIANWTFTVKDHISNALSTVTGKKISENEGEAIVTITLPYESYQSMVTPDNPGLLVSFIGTATSNFHTGDKSTGTAVTNSDGGSVPVPVTFEPMVISVVAPHEMLDTERFKILDTSPQEELYTRTVRLEGIMLSKDQADLFLSGNYTFPFTGADKIYTYTITYNDTVKKIEFEYINYLCVYTTKPKAQFKVTGTFKENRLIEANTDIETVNSSYLKANASIALLSFTAKNLSGSSSIIKYGIQSSSKLQFIVKGRAQIAVQMQVSALVNPGKIERSDIPPGYQMSDVFNYALYTQEDYSPALIGNIWNSALIRNERLDFQYDASSVDLDVISVNTVKIYYDQNGDETPEMLISQGDFADFSEFKPASLGYYKIVFYAEETFGQPTLAQHITALDKKSATLERTFYVDNLSPMTKIYTDIEYDFPALDLIVLNDADIARELNNSIVSQRVDFTNNLRQTGILANIQIWDLHTYVYSQNASTAKNTGSSAPPAEINYSSGGYNGTLSKYQTVNNPYQVDYGNYQTVTDTISISDTQFNSGYATYVRNASGWYVSRTYAQNGLTQLPATLIYSSGGYQGSMTKVGGGTSSDTGAPSGGAAGDTYTRYTTWYANYSGTASKQVQVWQSYWVWINDYTGYYSGSVYKSVKQTFSPQFTLNSDKILVYFTGSAVNNMTDIQSVLNKGTCKVVLVGDETARVQLTHDYFINSSKPLAEIMEAINAIISDANTNDNKQTVLIDETFSLSKADYDDENDPITDIGYAYVQDALYYDNSMGQEAGTSQTYQDALFSANVKSVFTKVGRYSIYRKIKDNPTGKLSFSKESNIPVLDVYVHRIPVADFILQWDYDAASATYKTTWTDKSYDLDHEFTDPDRGIRDRKIMYRNTTGDTIWHYGIPDKLSAGTYELKYTVKDIEGTWSNELTKIFVLSINPPIQLFGKLKPNLDSLKLSALPASEYLNAYDIRTIYYEPHSLQTSIVNSLGQTIYQDAARKNTDLPQSNINGNYHTWMDTLIQTNPARVDGDYLVRLKATSTLSPSIVTTLDLPFKINTPIRITGDLSDVSINKAGTVRAITNKYASAASVTLFKNTSYSANLPLKLSAVQNISEMLSWEAPYQIPASLPAGAYDFLFTASTPSGKTATHLLSKEIDSFMVSSVEIIGRWNHWRGQVDVFGERLLNQPHRFLSYEKIDITAVVIGDPDEVMITLSPNLEAMQYTNSLGQRYSYLEEFGYEVTFPIKMTRTADPVGADGSSRFSAQLILPLCDETLSWSNQRLNTPYYLRVEALKGALSTSFVIEDIEMTGNIFDLIYVQPKY